jgi:hypothetical protein
MVKWRIRSWRGIAKLQSKPSTVSDKLPNTSLHHLDFYDRVNFPRLRENRQAG